MQPAWVMVTMIKTKNAHLALNYVQKLNGTHTCINIIIIVVSIQLYCTVLTNYKSHLYVKEYGIPPGSEVDWFHQ